MRISDWSSDVCSSDLPGGTNPDIGCSNGSARLAWPTGASRGHGGGGGRQLVDGRQRRLAHRLNIVTAGAGSQLPIQAASMSTRTDTAGEDPTIEDRGQLIRVFEQRSEEHTSELQSLMRISYAVFCLKKNMTTTEHIAINIDY